ncbi:MAG: transporter substrate-binding domain-containing protein [Deltaproteobacteria bacterium]|nr:transporter substrate-binding domain-containing protein [Deltaproteobacteria bacterium]TLN04141.1 MAG: transporter substrate-binding domain-containing protein [bacterium]
MNKYVAAVIGFLLVLLNGFSLSADEQRVVRVGAFNYYPAIFKDRDGAVKGFYVDTLTELGQRENIRFEYVYGSWSEGLERIKTGEVDLLTSVAYTDERAEFLDYGTIPLLTVWGELYVQPSSEIDGIRAVQGAKVGVMKGDFNARYFIDLVKKFTISCEFVELESFDDVFTAIAAKKVDAGVVNSTYGVAKQHEYGLRSSGIVFNPFDIHFAVAKGKNQRLLALLDRYLHSWRHQADSPYTKARQKWSHGNTGIIQHIPRWLVTSFAALVVMAFGAGVFVLVLKRQVRNRTRSLAESSQQYQQLSARLHALLAAVPDIIMEAGIDRVYTWANSAGKEFFGDDVVG